jgi:alpha-D-ribose 1-methylphosphonate 5-triphosphate diphosphatase
MQDIRRISGGRALLPQGMVIDAELAIEEGVIISVGQPAAGACLDAAGLLVLPGLVDIHGDAFERQLSPRPEVRFPTAMALHDTDRQLVSNGITTAFHGITCSWESGLRSRDMARELVEHFGGKTGLAADNRVHLRFENHNLDAVEEVLCWMEEGHVDLLAFNDHLPAILKRVDDAAKLGKYADRSGVSVGDFREQVLRAWARHDEVEDAVSRLAAMARKCRIATASHDDMTRDDRSRYQALGCVISEFPMRAEAAMAAMEFGNQVIMGAPNVVRGGSHLGGIRAADMVGEGVCTILASDYFYPALLGAPFRLAREGICPLESAWHLVSRNPARAAGFADRGELVAGGRADIVLVDDSVPGMPKVVATIVAGRLAYAARSLTVH